MNIKVSGEIPCLRGAQLSKHVAEKIESIALKHGVSGDALVNTWLQERINAENKK
jgi:hypothetical protein